MNSTLLGFLLIAAGLGCIIAHHQQWSWYVNHYQIRSAENSFGEFGAFVYTCVMCSPCLLIGAYLILFYQ